MKMPNKIDVEMLAPCGINCMVCYRHLTTKRVCLGCLLDDQNKPEHCRECKIKKCASEKGIIHCFVCNDFPCKSIKNLEKSYIKRYKTSLVENSHSVKCDGIESFMEKEKIKWTCRKCGGIISLHDTECSDCHTIIQIS